MIEVNTEGDIRETSVDYLSSKLLHMAVIG